MYSYSSGDLKSFLDEHVMHLLDFKYLVKSNFLLNGINELKSVKDSVALPSYNALKLRCLYLRFFFTVTYSHLRPKTLNTHKPVNSDEVSRGAESDDISTLPYCSICDRYFSSTSWYSKVSSMRILSHDLFDIVLFCPSIRRKNMSIRIQSTPS